MSWINSKLFSNIMSLTNHIFLSILWFLCCIPIFTIVLSTASLFAVVNRWKTEGNNKIFSPFIKEFNNHFSGKMIINIILLIFFIVLYQDLTIIEQNSSISFIVLLLFFLSMVFVISTCVHMFNLLYYDKKNNLYLILKNSLIISLAQFHITILGVSLILTCIIAIYFVPILLFISGSTIAYVLTKISDRALINLKLIS